MNRTKRYKFTVDMNNGSPAGDAVAILRKQITEENKTLVKKRYVKLQGRGPRLGIRRYNQGLPLSYAVTADVYVYDR